MHYDKFGIICHFNFLTFFSYSKVPEEFVLQHPTNGNPPTLFLVLRGKFACFNKFLIAHWEIFSFSSVRKSDVDVGLLSQAFPFPPICLRRVFWLVIYFFILSIWGIIALDRITVDRYLLDVQIKLDEPDMTSQGFNPLDLVIAWLMGSKHLMSGIWFIIWHNRKACFNGAV